MIQATGTHLFSVPLPLEEGELLGNPQVAWAAYGEPSDGKAVVLLHDVSQSHRALGPVEDVAYQPSGWARTLVGEGLALDPASTPVVVPGLLGSPFGTTSPASADPATGERWGINLPPLTVLDMARGVSASLRAMGLQRVRALVGVGLGGQVALRLAALFPELAAGVVTLGTARALPEGVREKLGLSWQLLRADPDFREGLYGPDTLPRKTMRRLRLDFQKLLYGREYLASRWPDPESARVALEAEADAFAETFDPVSWATLCSAYAGCDVADCFPHIRARVLLVAGSTDALAPVNRVRDTYHLLSAAGVSARLLELPGPGDHGALLTDADRLHGPLSDFLRRC
ncbi:alpha/beta fold hydrolase [Pyxidicoccus parkwayensis]|uniref:Alpha/beta fold hydrolase n=1 Tax=Pyxidicoccus parkwayensis TaxID=2813578 RepID=A0ABX7P547_9BACT|nr:alpha/beta fold hydrolase [Pyxidicoccus parkwaysis]QSQ25609.1 alpha/beta fold hydrolase [Pyxidicoccus parkwaysis]